MGQPTRAELEAQIEQIKAQLKRIRAPQERERLIDALCDAALALAQLKREASTE
jgi:hypothetical protein